MVRMDSLTNLAGMRIFAAFACSSKIEIKLNAISFSFVLFSAMARRRSASTPILASGRGCESCRESSFELC
jgi:hypothetical protein